MFERVQKPEQHLASSRATVPPTRISADVLTLDFVRRFTEAAAKGNRVRPQAARINGFAVCCSVCYAARSA